MLREMKAEDWQEVFDLALSELDAKVTNLLVPPFSWHEIVAFLTAAMTVAEDLFPEAENGVNKKSLVMAIWNHYEKQYKLIEKLDSLVDFTKILGHPVGDLVEMWDGTILRKLLEDVIIPVMVSFIFPPKVAVPGK